MVSMAKPLQSGSTRTSCVHFGDGDVAPAWQALRRVTSKSSIFGGKDVSPLRKKENITLKTIYVAAKVPPSSKRTESNIQKNLQAFRGEMRPPLFRNRAFYKVLSDASTHADEDRPGADDRFTEGYEEDATEVDEEDSSEYLDESEEGFEEIKTVLLQGNIEVEGPSGQVCKESNQTDQKKGTCPWKILAIVLLIFSLSVVAISMMSQFEVTFDSVDIIGDLSLLIAPREEPEVVKEFPSFLERCRHAVYSRTEVVDLLSRIDFIGVLAIGFVIFVIIP